ncbi:MAG: fumarate hydratase [Candidatus Omnitrophota bacterium]
MIRISEKEIREAVAGLCIEANIHLRPDVLKALKKALPLEKNHMAKKILNELLENAAIAKDTRVALCQDTGMAVVFVEIGRDVDLGGCDIARAVNSGVEDGYKRGNLRDSIVSDPILRLKKSGFSPAVIHFDFTRKNGMKLTVLPKGFGCENKTALKMFNPTASAEEIEDFIFSVVKKTGPDACPPYVLGVGIGGTSDYACQLSKKALLRPIDQRNRLVHVARMEAAVLKKVNSLNIGPMGLGGKTTALAVNIDTYPTHIAGLPVAVNVSCHVLRSAAKVLR